MLLLLFVICFGKEFLAINQHVYQNVLLPNDTFQNIKERPSLGFQENKGQMMDMKGNPAPYVLFKTEVPGLNIWVTKTGLTYQFFKIEKHIEQNENGIEEKKKLCSWKRVDMILKNASIKKENIITEGNVTKGEINYYNANCPDGIFAVRTFSKLVIQDIYKGIDWVLYTSPEGTSIKQDFVVDPSADPSQIKLLYEGNGDLVATKSQISINNNLGAIQEGKLFCYQNSTARDTIESSYVIDRKAILSNLGAGNLLEHSTEFLFPSDTVFSYEITLNIDKYDVNRPLIIDPELVWATFYGGNDLDGPYSIDTDPTGNVFATGYSSSTNFPVLDAGNGAYFQSTPAPSLVNDMFVLKFDNSGVLLWSTLYGGDWEDAAHSLVADDFGNVFVVGKTESSNMPTYTSSGIQYSQSNLSSSIDIFILKLDNNGVRLWATYYGGNNTEYANSICTDSSGNIYVTGVTRSTDFPCLDPGGGAYYQSSFGGGGGDFFIIKFNNAGTRQWATYYGGAGTDEAFSVNTDPFGNLLILGVNLFSDFPVTNAFQALNAGGGDAVIAKFSNTGQELWSTHYGGSNDEYAYSIMPNYMGDFFIVGTTWSSDFPTIDLGNGAYYDASKGSSRDVFIAKFSGSGNPLWSTYYGANGMESINTYDNIVIDTCNNLYISFNTRSTNIDVKNTDPCLTNFFNDTSNSPPDTNDIFLTQFTDQGKLLWASYFGGNGKDLREALAIDANNNLFITGEWTAANSMGPDALIESSYPLKNPGGLTYYDDTYNTGGDDGFFAKFVPPTLGYTLSQNNATNCFCDGRATFSFDCANPPYSYEWRDANNTVVRTITGTDSYLDTLRGMCAGTYTLIASSNCNQSVTVGYTITGLAPPELTVGSDQTISCISPDVSLTSNSTNLDLSYSWTGPSGFLSGQNTPTPIVNLPGTYTVTVTDSVTNCTAQDTVIVNIDTIRPNISSSTGLILNCNITSGVISVVSMTSGVLYNWTGTNIITGANTSSPTIDQEGMYIATVSNPINGCINTVTVDVAYQNDPVAELGSNENIELGSSIRLDATGSFGGSLLIYNWSPSAGLDCTNCPDPLATPANTTTYIVTVTDANGCQDTAQIKIFVENCEEVFIPNAFSPDGRGDNELECVFGNCLESVKFVIFDRWGEKVFESANIGECWDGNYRGKPMQTDIFAYTFHGVLVSGEEIKKQGSIALIR